MFRSKIQNNQQQPEQLPIIYQLSYYTEQQNLQHTRQRQRQKQRYTSKYRNNSNSKYFDIKILKQPLQISKIVQISCGANFSILLDLQNRVFSFGNNEYGQLGYEGEFQDGQVRNIKINRKFQIKGVRCGFTHVVVFGDKECYGWGDHSYGALGFQPEQISNPWMPRKLPIFVTSSQQILDINCGNNTTIFNISNNFYCLGDNHQGQLAIFPKKPIFNPQKIQIQKYPPPKKTPKLTNIKAGDKFTIGIDQNGQLYGAGQLSKLGLIKNGRNLLSLGLSQLQYKKDNKLVKLCNVQDFECGVDLVVKYLGVNQYLHVFTKDLVTIDLQIKQQNAQDIQIIGSNSQFVVGKIGNNHYKWNMDNPKNKETIFQQQQDGDIKIILGCKKLQNDIILVQNTSCYKPYFQSNLIKNIQFQPRFPKSTRYQQKPHQKSPLKLSPSLLKQQQHSIQLSSQKFQLLNLRKQNLQQKQIIRLFQQYCKKLQIQNQQLKQKISKVQSQQHQQQDKVTDCIHVLKSMLKKTLKQYTQKNNL